jgi:hypothetical protein
MPCAPWPAPSRARPARRGSAVSRCAVCTAERVRGACPRCDYPAVSRVCGERECVRGVRCALHGARTEDRAGYILRSESCTPHGVTASTSRCSVRITSLDANQRLRGPTGHTCARSPRRLLLVVRSCHRLSFRNLRTSAQTMFTSSSNFGLVAFKSCKHGDGHE